MDVLSTPMTDTGRTLPKGCGVCQQLMWISLFQGEGDEELRVIGVASRFSVGVLPFDSLAGATREPTCRLEFERKQ